MQPWYFCPNDVAVDKKGNVYVVDAENSLIHKYTANGQLITKWGGNGSAPGKFSLIPNVANGGIAIDATGIVYVSDSLNSRIQKFTPNGDFIIAWGGFGDGPGQFKNPEGIAVDGVGNVYVADDSTGKIQKFDPDGNYLGGVQGFIAPKQVDVDRDGNVYVVDAGSYHVYKMDPQFNVITYWGGFTVLGEAGKFFQPYGIAIDDAGAVYVSDEILCSIQKFTGNGVFLEQFGTCGDSPGQTRGAVGLASDGQGNLYVCDRNTYRVHKFSTQGRFIHQWSNTGTEAGFFSTPHDLVLDGINNVYVLDTFNNRIQKFDAEGRFLMQWGDYGLAPGQFNLPSEIDTDGQGFVYVLDRNNHRIQKFDSEGQFVREWGSDGHGDGEFSWDNQSPKGKPSLAVDVDGTVYAADPTAGIIQKFTADGEFLLKWGELGDEVHQFDTISGLAVDTSGFVYVADREKGQVTIFEGASGNYLRKIDTGPGLRAITVDVHGNVFTALSGGLFKQFSSNGELLHQWGGQGYAPGLSTRALGLSASPGGHLYVADTRNHRVQLFEKVNLPSKTKSIVVAGGGPFAGNHLWESTQLSANLAYMTLGYQGFGRDAITYLSADVDLDLDMNGVADDVDGDATNANLMDAVTSWASDADNLVIYLVDHGGDGVFRMSGTETLSAAALNGWLDQLQQVIPGNVIVIYDACESGSFLNKLMPPPGKRRLVVTSAAQDEPAYFVSHGSVSFSNYFWTHIFNGVDVKDAFNLTRQALTAPIVYQHPLIDANNNGIGNEPEDYSLTAGVYIGNATDLFGDAPAIGSVSGAQTINDANAAPLYAEDVLDSDGIARVWAVLRPPDYAPGSASNPIDELPAVDFTPVGEGRFEAVFDGFDREGTYQVAIYALDNIGNTSVPVLTTVTVATPQKRRAIIVIGGSQSDPNWPAKESLALQAFASLRFQGYQDDDIYFMSPVTFSSGVDAAATLGNLEYAVTTWAAESTRDVVLYMIGSGAFATFEIGRRETLTAETLDSWIDALQSDVSGPVTIVYDAPQSGSFLPVLTPPENKERIVIASADDLDRAHYLSDGDISFSKFFWRRVLDGMNTRDAFINAKNAIRYLQGQTPQLDDNSNGIGNEKSDGLIARDHGIGVGIMLAGDDPIIGSVMPELTLNGETGAQLWAQDVTTTGTIERVWAVITPPARPLCGLHAPVTELPAIDLVVNADTHRWEGSYDGFTLYGAYGVAVYAKDTAGNISMPATTSITQAVGADVYESDDAANAAGQILINAASAQRHTFHVQGDQDWVAFYAIAGEAYEIKTENLGPRSDTVIVLFDAEMNQLTNPDPPDLVGDSYGYGEGELVSWQCPADGIYYAMIRQYDNDDFGLDTEYDLSVYHPVGGTPGMLIGQVSDGAGDGIEGAVIKAIGINGTAISVDDGYFIMVLPSGTYIISVELPGYSLTQQQSVSIISEGTAAADFQLDIVFNGDVNGDGKLDILDLIVSLKSTCGLWDENSVRLDYSGSGQDVNGDQKIGMEEVIYILQRISDVN
jgi:streptogramin lyase